MYIYVQACRGQGYDAVRIATAVRPDEDSQNCWKRIEDRVGAGVDLQRHAAAIAAAELLYHEPLQSPNFPSSIKREYAARIPS